MNKLTTSLVIAGLLSPVGAQALGVGEIKLQSFLNQTLRAEIPLVLSEEKLSDLRVLLAPPKDFAAAGLERSQVLTKLRFDLVRKIDGSFVIRVGSSDVIHEPFLSFLVELTWPQGRMLRSFTVLLDPPDVLAQPSFPARSSELDTDDSSLPTMRQQSSPISLPTAAAISQAGQTPPAYGPVERNEKLWAIAEKVNHDPSITQEQMVMALFRFNPQAFSRPSVNALNAGAMLRIPEREYILDLSPSLAREEFFRHQAGRTARWMKDTTTGFRPQSERPQPRTEPTPASTLPAKLPVETPQTAHPRPGVQSDAGMRALEALRRENEEMRTRLAELEKRVSELQILFSEKEMLAANAQTRGTSEHETVAGADSARASASGLVAPAPAPGHSGLATTTDANTSLTAVQGVVTPVPDQNVKAAAAADETLAKTPTPAVPGSKPAEGNLSAPAPQVATNARNAQPAAVNNAPPAAENQGPTAMWLLAGAGALVASLLATFYVRRSRARHVPLESSNAVTGPTQPETAEAVSAISDHVDPPDAVIISEASTSKEESEDVDPIFESDIYLSYGKYGQAKETIESAIRRHPEREAYRLKLMEIYLTKGDTLQFEAYAAELKSRDQFPSVAFWDRVAELAKRHCPASAFNGSERKTAENSPETLAIPVERPLDDTDRLIDELKRFSIEVRSNSASAEPDITESGNPHYCEQPQQDTAEQSSDHEIAWVPADASPPPSPLLAKTDDSAISSVDSDHLIPFDPASTSGADQPSTFEDSSSESIDTLLKELSAIHYERHFKEDEGNEANGPASGQRENATAHLVNPITAATPEKAVDASRQAAASDDSGKQADDLETKLDLARAYADMGDYAQAKDFLHEVIDQGSEPQKAEATELLATLSGV